MDIPYIKIFIVLVICWIAQLYFNALQVQKFHKRFRDLRKLGNYSAVGMAGKYWQGRVFAVLVCDNEGDIKSAEYLSGATVFSRLQPLCFLLGVNIQDINENNYFNKNIKKKKRQAFVQAASFIQRAISKENTSSDANIVGNSETGGLVN